MKTLYIECNMGSAGDMLTAALLELLPHPEEFIEKLNGLGIPGVEYSTERTERGGIVGTHVKVTVNGTDEADPEHGHHHHDHDHHHDHGDHDHHHHDHEHDHHHHDDDHGHPHHHEHRNMEDIRKIVSELDVTDEVRQDIMQVYDLIAEAESEAHGRPAEEIHFHEVGSMDAIADITAVSMLLREIAPEQIIVSSVATGSGTVKCAHGVLPVPAPATARILTGIPTHTGDVEAELCTPTGAALLKCIADDFGPRPEMVADRIGYGMGTRDFGEIANMLRVFLGDAENVDEDQEDDDADSNERPFSDGSIWVKGTANNEDPVHNRELSDNIVELKCNLDDMTGEQIGFVVDQLLFNGAVDAFLTPIYMKKNRPATLLTCLCREELREEMIQLIFRYTSTIGIRETLSRRYILDRSEFILHTDEGPIRTKHVRGYGVDRKKYEYDDLARLARGKHISIQEAKEYVDKRGTY